MKATTCRDDYGGAIVVSYDSRQFDFGGFAPNGVTYFCDPLPPGGCAPIVTTTGFAETVRFGFENANNTNVVGTFSFTANGAIGNSPRWDSPMRTTSSVLSPLLPGLSTDGLDFSGASVRP